MAAAGGCRVLPWVEDCTLDDAELPLWGLVPYIKKYNKVLMRFNEQKYLNCHSNVILYSLSQSARRFVDNSKEFFG